MFLCSSNNSSGDGGGLGWSGNHSLGQHHGFQTQASMLSALQVRQLRCEPPSSLLQHHTYQIIIFHNSRIKLRCFKTTLWVSWTALMTCVAGMFGCFSSNNACLAQLWALQIACSHQKCALSPRLVHEVVLTYVATIRLVINAIVEFICVHLLCPLYQAQNYKFQACV